jgi:hypothetical protein
VKSWSGFKAGTEEAILPVSQIMALLSTPRHAARLNGDYVSASPGYAPLFFQRIKEVTGNASFWNPAAG